MDDHQDQARTDRVPEPAQQVPPHMLVARNTDSSTNENWLAQQDTQGPPSFIQIYPDVISRDICTEIITRFENDPRIRPSWGNKSDKPANRTGSMLDIGYLPDWADLTNYVTAQIEERIHHFSEVFLSFKSVLMTGECYLTPPLLERIVPDQGFDWHSDGSMPKVERRVLALILYLADVPEGGETQFAYQGAGVSPTAGSLVVFPPFWTHLHRGATPKSTTKYNITNFVNLIKPTE
jgi:hypothetical protein